MPKRQKRTQHHLNQSTNRRKSYTSGGTSPTEIYKPGFPMNLFRGSQVPYIIFGVIIISTLIVGAIAAASNQTDRSIPDVATPTATVEVSATSTPDPNATPSVSPTPVRTFSAAEQVTDATKKYTATIKTDRGDIVLDLFADKAPATVNTFVFLARKGYFDGLTFHRVDPNFVVQGGDPKGNGTGGPGFQTEEDKNDLKNTRGMISMAKAGAVTNFGSQFFVNLKDNPALDVDSPTSKRFYPWAQVTSGMDVVDKLLKGDVMRSVTITEK